MGFDNEKTALKSATFEKPECASNQFQPFFSQGKTGTATGQTDATPIRKEAFR